MTGIGASQREKDLSRLLYRICGSGFSNRLKYPFRADCQNPKSAKVLQTDEYSYFPILIGIERSLSVIFEPVRFFQYGPLWFFDISEGTKTFSSQANSSFVFFG